MTAQKGYLFLQGPSSPLFARIAEHLTAADRSCFRINLNVGDQIFWRLGGSFCYREGLAAWGSYIRAFMDTHDIGTIIMLGEERPYHGEAVRAAKERGIDVVAIEMGYLRPDWVTVERDGLSSNSHFPRDPAIILDAAKDLPEPDWTRKYSQTFVAEALYDLAYYLPSVFLGFLYPRYHFHGIYHPLAEYMGWIGRLITENWRNKRANRLTQFLTAGSAPWFVYPLQLETDYQLRVHSPYNSQREAIAEIIRSFANHADRSAKLAIKVHPLDNGLISWGRFVGQEAKKNDVMERVVYLDGGDFNALVQGSCGIVTVNSTAALHGLKKGVAVKVLGTAVYDVHGMTDQQVLDGFWGQPKRPDPTLTAAFFRLMAATIQERGNFYSNAGSSAAAEAIARRLVNGAVISPRVNVGTN
jgi:capsular polysaccharide export protein